MLNLPKVTGESMAWTVWTVLLLNMIIAITDSCYVMFLCPAKTAEPNEMPFGEVWGSDSCRTTEPCSRWGPDPSSGRGNYRGCPSGPLKCTQQKVSITARYAMWPFIRIL